MALMVWNEALVDGVASIDSQHHELVDLLNALYDSAQAAEGGLTVRLFDELLKHTVAHFRHEEAMFINTAYPDADRHRHHHDLITAKAIEFRDCAAAGDFKALTAEILPKLRDFFVYHIQKDDKDTCAFLNAHGIC